MFCTEALDKGEERAEPACTWHAKSSAPGATQRTPDSDLQEGAPLIRGGLGLDLGLCPRPVEGQFAVWLKVFHNLPFMGLFPEGRVMCVCWSEEVSRPTSVVVVYLTIF